MNTLKTSDKLNNGLTVVLITAVATLIYLSISCTIKFIQML